MLKVKRTKNPSIKQASNMMLNLKEKFKKDSNIDIKFMSWYSNLNHIRFWIYIEDLYCLSIDSWEELQDRYFELMEEPNA